MISEPSSSGLAGTGPRGIWTLEPGASLYLLGRSTTGRISFVRGDGSPVTRVANHIVVAGQLMIGYQRGDVIADAIGAAVTYVVGEGTRGIWGVTVTGTARSLNGLELSEVFAATRPHSHWNGIDAVVRVQNATIAGHLVASARA